MHKQKKNRLFSTAVFVSAAIGAMRLDAGAADFPAAAGHALSAFDEPSNTLAVVRPFSRELLVFDCAGRAVKARAALPFDAAAVAVDVGRGRVYAAAPDALRVYALPDLRQAAELPLAGARFLAVLSGGELAAATAAGTVVVARPEPYAVARTVKLEPGERARRLNARIEPACRYVVRVMRRDAARDVLHIIVGPEDGGRMYSREHKPLDAWLAVKPQTGEVVPVGHVLAPCADLAVDERAGRVYGISRAYNADHVFVVDAAALRPEGVIPLDCMDARNLDRIAPAPRGLLAVGSSLQPKQLFFVAREDLPQWPAPTEPEFLERSASEIERLLQSAGLSRREVIAHTVSLWGLRGAWDALHFSESGKILYLPGERGVIAIEAEAVAGLRRASLPTQACYQREGEPPAEALRRAPQSLLICEHNTLAPERALTAEEAEAEGNAFRFERYVLPGPLGIFPIDIPAFALPRGRPRIFITQATLPAVRAKCEGPLREQFRAFAAETRSYRDRVDRPQNPVASWPSNTRILADAALCYLLTGEETFLDMVRRFFRYFMAHPEIWKPTGGQDEDNLTPVVGAFDWCYAGLTAAEREEIGKFIFEKLKTPEPQEFGVWHRNGNWDALMTHNHEIGWRMQEIVSAVALHDEPWLAPADSEAMVRRSLNGLCGVFAANQEAGWDGGNPEAGYTYSIRDLEIPLALAVMWQIATGQSLLEQAGFIGRADAWVLYGVRPDLKFTKMGEGGIIPDFGKDGKYYTFNTFSNHIMAWWKKSPYFQWVSKATGPQDRGYLYFIFFDPDMPATPTHADRATEPQLKHGELLPLAQIFRGVGYLFSKSGWDPDAAHVYFCGREWRKEYHETMENNAFQIFKGGPLLIDAGYRWGMTAGYAYSYLRSTLSKNSMLIYDPAERPADSSFFFSSGSSFNVGGQLDFITKWQNYKTIRLLDRGGFQAYENHPLFMYVSADATGAYAYHKLRWFNRQLLHVRPDTVIVFDRVISRNPAFKKTFLLHSIHEPELRGAEFAVYAGRGLLRGKTLLPEKAVAIKIGGPGKEFWVGEDALFLDFPDREDGKVPTHRLPNFSPLPEAFMGVGSDGYYKPPPEPYSAPVPNAVGVQVGDYKPGQEPKTVKTSPLDEMAKRSDWGVKTADEWLQKFIVECEAGAWRMEISPAAPQPQDFFLHVFHAAIPAAPPENAAEAFSAPAAALFPASELLREGDMLGARVALPDGRLVEVLFETVRRPGGIIRITDAGGAVEMERRLTESIDRTPRR